MIGVVLFLLLNALGHVQIEHQLKQCATEQQRFTVLPENCVKFLTAGRLVQVGCSMFACLHRATRQNGFYIDFLGDRFAKTTWTGAGARWSIFKRSRARSRF
jgi:hypothetical protein